MQARVADQIAFDDISRYYQVTDVLGNHHQRSGQNGEDGEPFKTRLVEGWQREPVRFGDRGGIDHAHHKRQRIAHQNANQDRDNRQEAAEQDRTKHRHRQGHHRDNNGFTVRRLAVGRQQPGHVGRHARQLQTDNRHDGPHRRRGEHHIQPAGTGFFDNKGDEAEQHAAHNETAQRHFIAQRQQEQHRRDKGETRSQIRRDFAFTDKEVQQRTNTVEQQHGGRVDVEQDWHQHRCAKHGKQVLQTKRDSL